MGYNIKVQPYLWVVPCKPVLSPTVLCCADPSLYCSRTSQVHICISNPMSLPLDCRPWSSMLFDCRPATDKYPPNSSLVHQLQNKKIFAEVRQPCGSSEADQRISIRRDESGSFSDRLLGHLLLHMDTVSWRDILEKIQEAWARVCCSLYEYWEPWLDVSHDNVVTISTSNKGPHRSLIKWHESSLIIALRDGQSLIWTQS